MSDEILWIDLETTGLEPTHDRILECAVVVTEGTPDAEGALKPIHAESWVIQLPNPEQTIPKMATRVVEMHSRVAPGFDLPLLAEAIESTFPLTALDAELCKIADQHAPRAPLGGSSVHFDRSFLRQWCPQFVQRVSYRNIDVSTIHELCKRWYDSHHEDPIDPPHRALPDIAFSIKRLQWYKARVFSPYGRKS